MNVLKYNNYSPFLQMDADQITKKNKREEDDNDINYPRQLGEPQ